MHERRRTALVALLTLLLAGVLAFPMRSNAAGSVVYVDAGANGANNGSSWADAYPSLADALAGAAPGTEIWVAAATYTAIYGGFAGGETQREQRDWQTNVTLRENNPYLGGGMSNVNSSPLLTDVNPDIVVEIADRESAEARATAMQQAMDSGAYAPLGEGLFAGRPQPDTLGGAEVV